MGGETDITELLRHGSLPLVRSERSAGGRIDLLEAYVETYLTQEIRAEALVRSLEAFARFLEVAALANAQVTNVAALARDAAVARPTVQGSFDDGGSLADLARRVAMPTESQNTERAGALTEYVDGEMRATLTRLEFTCTLLTEAKARGPLLYAERLEDPQATTVFSYGHGDVIQCYEFYFVLFLS